MRFAYLLSLCVLGGLCGASRAQKIAVYPPDINLETSGNCLRMYRACQKSIELGAAIRFS